MKHEPLSPSLVDALARFGAATIYEAQGAFGALGHELKPLDGNTKMVGTALTVEINPHDNMMLHYALTRAQPGDVLVVDAKDCREAGVWGDVLTEQAMTVGLAGLVVNGAVRDAQTIIEMGFPVFSKALSIKGTKKNQPGKINVPLMIDGVQINPGDVIVGDRDGLVVVPRHNIETVLENTIARENKEDLFKEKIRTGVTTVELFNMQPALKRFDLL